MGDRTEEILNELDAFLDNQNPSMESIGSIKNGMENIKQKVSNFATTAKTALQQLSQLNGETIDKKSKAQILRICKLIKTLKSKDTIDNFSKLTIDEAIEELKEIASEPSEELCNADEVIKEVQNTFKTVFITPVYIKNKVNNLIDDILGGDKDGK